MAGNTGLVIPDRKFPLRGLLVIPAQRNRALVRSGNQQEGDAAQRIVTEFS